MAALSEEAPLLEVRDLRVAFRNGAEEALVVDGLSFAMDRGEIVALVGESGSGKTMTALSLLRLLPQAARVIGGEVRYAGVDLLVRSEVEMEAIRGRHLAMVLQDPMGALNPVLPVGRQMGEVLQRHAGLSPRAVPQRAAQLLAEVGLPDPDQRLRQYPHQLSGGMRQRVLIAQALAGAPKLLIADEPTTALDMTLRAQIRALLADLRRTSDLAVLLITHDLGAVAGLADRVVVMYAGRMMEAGPTRLLLTRPAHPYTRALLDAVPRLGGGPGRLVPIQGHPPDPMQPTPGCPFHPRCERAEPICREFAPPQRTLHSPGHLVACWLSAEADPRAPLTLVTPVPRTEAPAQRAAAPILAVRDLARHFNVGSLLSRRVVRAVDGVSFDLAEGETLALVGESGSGKTTLGRTILRLYRPTAGSMHFRGTDISTLRESALAPLRRQIGAIFQDPTGALNLRMTVADLIAEPLQVAGASALAAKERVQELLGLVGLSSQHGSRLPHQLSGGQRQRVSIARALALNPRLVVADEPVSALDVSVQAQVINLMADLKDRFGLSYLFITHDLALCRYLADRVAVMYHGKLVEIGPTATVLQRPAHPYTRSLMNAVPRLDPDQETRRLHTTFGLTAPAAQSLPSGCRYRTSCPGALPACAEAEPPLRMAAAGHQVACFEV